MRSALAAESAVQEKLVDAQTLREMTITKEELFNRQRDNVLDAIMSSMTGVASTKGDSQYVAQLTPQFDAKLLAEVVAKFEALGYKVTNEARTLPDNQDGSKGQSYIALTISWAQEQ